MTPQPAILFTAFEPSGDEHAAPVIAALLRRDSTLRICALGGPRMQAAGAELLETTTTRSVMGAGVLSEARAHRSRLARLKKWIDANPVRLHVPTDSPAANWAICRMVKKRWAAPTTAAEAPRMGAVVHLVAPQVWAWASWRVRRLRKWSDHVLCLLPFEPEWFARHNVPATFIGHPLFDQPLQPRPLDDDAPPGRPRLALLPGSRRGEVQRNWPIMRHVIKQLTTRFDDLAAVVAAADEEGEQLIRRSLPEAQTNIAVIRGRMEDVLAWSDAVLTVSGTATLHVARQLKPMAIVYAASPLLWHSVGRWLMNTRTFTLPNLIAADGPHRDPSRHIVPEFVPFLDDETHVSPIVNALAPLLEPSPQRDRQVESLRNVVARFQNHAAGEQGAEVIMNLLTPR